MGEPASKRLAEIAEQIRDGWVRGRGPLTGLKPLAAIREEAVQLGASETYLAILDEIISNARTISRPLQSSWRREAPAQLEAGIERLRALFREEAA
jgi:hypothetical protein